MKKFFLLFLFAGIWLFLFPIYRDRVPSFGCFDDCFNYMGGYFVNSGKHLYSDIFYNHQPILAYISAFLQRIGQPESMYELVLHHRLFVLLWSFAWGVFLALRFGWVGLAFSFLYETTKGYLFGERFLAEALIVYPLVYLVGLVGKKISSIERIVIAVMVWFVVFSREPYVPLALFLFVLLYHRISLVIFLFLTLVTVVIHSPKDYFFNVVTVNTILATGGNVFQSFAYPILILFDGNWNLFRQIEVGLAVLFWLELFFARHRISKKLFVLIFLILGLANIRPVEPGAIYYAAFHHLVGYGVFVFIALLLLQETKQRALWIGFALLVVFSVLSPQSYLRDRVDRNAEFTQNYGQYYVAGEVVRLLSEPADTLFLDGLDDLISWQAKRLSPYPYSWYTSVMHEFDVYTNARIKMFQENPPDFYYGKCSDDRLESILPQIVTNDYVRFFWQERPTCLFVHRAMYARIPMDRLEQVQRQFEYSVR